MLYNVCNTKLDQLLINENSKKMNYASYNNNNSRTAEKLPLFKL